LCACRIETARPRPAAAALTQLSEKHYSSAMTCGELLAARDRLGEILPDKAQIVIAGGWISFSASSTLGARSTYEDLGEDQKQRPPQGGTGPKARGGA